MYKLDLIKVQSQLELSLAQLSPSFFATLMHCYIASLLLCYIARTPYDSVQLYTTMYNPVAPSTTPLYSLYYST